MQEEVRVQESTAGLTGKGLSSLQKPFCNAALRPARRRFCAPEGRRMGEHRSELLAAAGPCPAAGSAARSRLLQGCSEVSSQFSEFPPSFLYTSPFLKSVVISEAGPGSSRALQCFAVQIPQQRTCSPALLLVGNQLNSWHSSLAWPCSFYSLLLS